MPMMSEKASTHTHTVDAHFQREEGQGSSLDMPAKPPAQVGPLAWKLVNFGLKKW